MKKTIILLFLLSLLMPFVVKYTFVQHNQYDQIPLILRYINPDYLKNDGIINSNAQFSPRIFFTILMGVFAKFTSLPFAYFAVYIITCFLFLSASFLIVFKIYKNKTAAFLSSVVYLMGQRITLGNNDDVFRDVDPAKISFSLVFVGYALFFYNRFYLSSVLFAISVYIQPLIGLEMPLIFYVSTFILSILNNIKLKNAVLLKSVALYIALIIPAISSYFFSVMKASNDNFVPKENILLILTKITLPHHYSPFTWPLTDYIKFFLIAGVFVYTLLNKGRISSKFRVLIESPIIIISVFCLISLFFIYILPNYYIVILQLFRLTITMHWLFVLVIYGYCFNVSNENPFIKAIITTLPFVLATINQLIYPSLNYSIFLFLIIIFSYIIFRHSTKHRLAISLIFILGSFAFLYRHYQFNFNRYYPFETPENKLALWVKENIPDNSLFLIPPGFFSFRLVAQKPIIVDWLVGPYQDKGITDWFNRIKTISGLNTADDSTITEQIVYDGYKSITNDRLKFIIEGYQINYAIIENNIQFPYPVIFKENNYLIYKI